MIEDEAYIGELEKLVHKLKTDNRNMKFAIVLGIVYLFYRRGRDTEYGR